MRAKCFGSSCVLVGLDRFFRVLKVPLSIVRHVDPGDALLNGYAGSRVPGSNEYSV